MVKIHVVTRKDFPLGLQRTVRRAAAATCQNIPQAVERRYLRKVGAYSIVISLVGPKAIQKLNAKYRKKNKPTDVLSFSRLDSTFPIIPSECLEVGDVLICWSIAKRQAKEYQTTIHDELIRLTVHGVLHLFGYDHEISAKEERRMFRLQERILKRL